jgi:hypothetical protein
MNPRLARAVSTITRPLSRMGRRTRWTLGIAAAILVIVLAASYLIDEPLRRTVESQMNARLTGYSVSLGKLRFHPIGLSLTLYDLVLVQQANPDPPVGSIPRLDASVHWRALLSGKLVADFAISGPELHLDIGHLRTEASDPEPVTDRGWQEALQAIYPLKINRFKIVNGKATYVDDGPFKPLELSRINVVIDNIRNVRSNPRDYPSPIHAEAVVFDRGTVAIDGHADFLATPHLGVKATVALEAIDLDYFKPVTTRYNVAVNKGVLSAAGLLEYAPTIKVVDLERATIDGVHVEYTHTPAKKGAVQAATAKTAEKAREVSNEPQLLLRAKQLKVVKSTVAFVNKAVDTPYRVFLSNTELTLENFSNQQADGTMVAKLTGTFMGSGATLATATFRPEKSGPDFDLSVRVENTDMRTMNDLLRAYGKFDVASGAFSVYSEIGVKNRRIEGYVKPLFSDLDVYSPEQDKQKSLGRKLYEKVVEGVSKVLKNTPRDEVATVATIAGPVEDAKANTVEVILKLIQNAFFKAILPGFDQQVRGLTGRRTTIR